ncbi:MAG: adenosine deaminase family protein [Halobacteriovoraceae bacterium]|nr:adenosine deaminase family protein [Halobacteriovoraceae bacterium]
MPKSDLHLHLDGSLRINSLIEMAKKMKLELPSFTEEGLKENVFKKSYSNLGEYLKGFQYTCAVLRDLENIEQIAYELAVDNQQEGVNYIEVRFAPQLLIDKKKSLTFESILSAANKGLNKAKTQYNNSDEVKIHHKPEFHYGIIACAMRNFGPKNYSPYYTNLFDVMNYTDPTDVVHFAAMEMVRASVELRDNKSIPIVGIDLAGQEEGFPAGRFKDVYAFAHKNFMHKTVHAGEAYGAESIFEAITECHADRIGHGYSLFMPNRILAPEIKDKNKYIQDLSSFIADQRCVIEVCLTSNMQTNPAIKSIREHKFKDMMDNRMATTICTDNRLVSNSTVTNEYRLAADNFKIPMKRSKDIVAYGFKKSFHPGNYVEKREFAKINMQYFDKVAKKHGLV